MKFGIHSSILLAVALTASAGLLSSCKKPAPEVAEEPEPLPAATPAAVAPPPPAPPLAVATPAPDPLAPPGIFFLLQKASITTDEGIVGLKPGQGLRQVGPGSYDVNGQTVPLRDDQVTNNLRIARQFAAADATAQAALRQALQPSAPKPPTTPVNPIVASATPVPRASAPPPAASTNPLSGGTRLGGGTGAADPETANRRNVKVDSSGRYYWRDSRGSIRYDF